LFNTRFFGVHQRPAPVGSPADEVPASVYGSNSFNKSSAHIQEQSSIQISIRTSHQWVLGATALIVKSNATWLHCAIFTLYAFELCLGEAKCLEIFDGIYHL